LSAGHEDIMQTLLLVIHVLIALALIGLVLIQHGKGADMGAAFGSGASTTVFGARGAGSFLTRTTAVLAALFFATSLGLAFLATRMSQAPSGSVVDSLQTPAAVPATAPPAGEGGDVPTLPSKPQ
jgi:preprotein translocase subunit SecG